MVSTALILLAGRYGAPVAIPTSIILAREIAVSALREWMSGKGLRNLVQVGFQGKLKTATTMLSLTLLLLVPAAGARCRLTLQAVSLLLLYLSTFITVTSGSLYFIAAAPFLNDERNVG
jgi:phosphatidylglycerophosphate synthase